MKSRLILANVFNLLDVGLTLLALSLGIGFEGNPVMALVTDKPGMFLSVKILGLLIVTSWIGFRTKQGDKIGNAASYIVLFALIAIVVWNTLVFALSII